MTPAERTRAALIADLQGRDPRREFEEHELLVLDKAALLADEIAALTELIDRHGYVSSGSRGQVCVSPFVTERRQACLDFAKLLAQIKLPEPSELSPARLQGAKAARSRQLQRASYAERRANVQAG